MKKELKQEFTMRIAGSNRSELILIMYEMLFVYMEDAKTAMEQGDRAEAKAQLRQCDCVLKELCDCLDFKYEISSYLYQIYTFSRKQLVQSMYQWNQQGIGAARKLLTNLYEAFQKAAEQDSSEALMKNAQKVYAGMTYQRGSQIGRAHV